VLGDFNLAPRIGDKPSGFTERSEREAFEAPLDSSALVDATAATGEPVFTFERWQGGKPIRFRCDLALLSACVGSTAKVIYDHRSSWRWVHGPQCTDCRSRHSAPHRHTAGRSGIGGHKGS
jgi:hypothetical protein